jgi:hypothetical protein
VYHTDKEGHVPLHVASRELAGKEDDDIDTLIEFMFEFALMEQRDQSKLLAEWG